jgi:hypothetical protein
LVNDQRDGVFVVAEVCAVPCAGAVAAGERLLTGSTGFRHASRFSQLLLSSSAACGDSVFLGSCGKAVEGEATRALIAPAPTVPVLRGSIIPG